MKTTFHFDWYNRWFLSSFKYLGLNFAPPVTMNCSVLLKCGNWWEKSKPINDKELALGRFKGNYFCMLTRPNIHNETW